MQPRFEIPSPASVKLKHASGRKEHHGEALVLAVDLRLVWTTNNRALSMFAGVRDALFTAMPASAADADDDDQDELDLPVSDLPFVRMPKAKYPLKFEDEYTGYTLRHDFGLGGSSDSVLPVCVPSRAESEHLRRVLRMPPRPMPSPMPPPSIVRRENIAALRSSDGSDGFAAAAKLFASVATRSDMPAPQGPSPEPFKSGGVIVMRRLYRTDGTHQDFDKPLTMAQCCELIGATSIDTVSLRHLGFPLHVMLVDDGGYEAKVVESGSAIELKPVRARKPLNVEGTRLYHRNCWPGVVHQIVGDVLVVPDEDFA